MRLRFTARVMLSVFCVLFNAAYAEEQKPAPPTLDETLRAVRSELRLDSQTGSMSGAGADVLRNVIDSAQFVFVGEDHITHEIPQFTAAVCDAMAHRVRHRSESPGR